MQETPLLVMKDIHKKFGGVHALCGVDFTLNKGEIHAVVGENGAGKSTLMNIIGGNITPTSGAMTLNGKEVVFNCAADAQANNITFIHQELSVFPNMDLKSNIFMESFASKKILSPSKDSQTVQAAQEILNKINLDCSPNMKLEDLAMGPRQMIEISRVFTRDTKILVLDEPTSSLTDKETEALFSFVRELSAKGVAVVYISHKLEEVFDIANKITVIKDGANIGTYNCSELNQKQLIELMIGTKINNRFPEKTHKVSRETEIEITNFSADKKFEQVNLTVAKGEVVGITGLLGAGRTELARCLFGLGRTESGTIKIEGKQVKIHNPSEAIDNGLAFVTENRGSEGLILAKSIKDNVVLAQIKKLRKHVLLFDRTAQTAIAADMQKKLNIKADSIEQLVCNLSGGNQQKVVLAKWISNNPKILILDEPTRGIDVGAKFEIYRLIDTLASQGVSVIFISSEVPEILGVCDSVAVMYKGRMSEKAPVDTVDQKKLMLMIQGDI